MAAGGEVDEHADPDRDRNRHPDVAEDGADLAEIWRTLAELGYPMMHVGAHAIGAMRVIGEQLRMAPTAPDQLAWLTGVDLRAAYGMQQRELSDRAERLLAWLAP